MDIDIYDFDKTIVPFDSGSLFWGYCIVHYPWIILLLPIQLVATILALFHIIGWDQYKKFCFLFVPIIPLEKAVKGFWNRHEKEVHKWFYDRKRECVVISASPDFLLEEIQKRLSFDHLISTKHSRKSGAIIGKNCRGEQKVVLFKEMFKNANVCDVYSDSYRHDKPIFSLANENCYHIEKSKAVKFDFSKQYN